MAATRSDIDHPDMDISKDLWELSRIVFSYPAIDNHAHAFLREEHKNAWPFDDDHASNDSPTFPSCSYGVS